MFSVLLVIQDGGGKALPITVAGYDKLSSIVGGGGPLISGELFECGSCMLPAIRARERKRVTNRICTTSICFVVVQCYCVLKRTVFVDATDVLF